MQVKVKKMVEILEKDLTELENRAQMLEILINIMYGRVLVFDEATADVHSVIGMKVNGPYAQLKIDSKTKRRKKNENPKLLKKETH